MAKTDTFRQAHDELLAIAGELSKHLNVPELEKDATAARSLLSKLAGKLVVHLAMEDKSLFPSLERLDNPKLNATLATFNKEMGGIKDAFTAYVNKWGMANIIKADAATFVKDTKGVFAALSNRINKENNELYKLIDALV